MRFATVGLIAAVTMAAHGQEGTGAAWVTPAAHARVSYHIFMPDAYEREAGRPFPVLSWLRGRGGGVPGRDMICQETYGADADYFMARSPWSMAEANSARLSDSTRIGIGFGLGRETGELALAMTNANDFVDTIARGAGLQEIKQLAERGVKVAAVFLSLEHMEETLAALTENGIRCAYLAYNPERNRHTTPKEIDNFVDSARTAADRAKHYGAPLVVGPGMRFMTEREEDYVRAAPHADVWLIQSQRFQVDKETGRRTPPEEYRKHIRRIADLVHQGNSKAKIWVQIMVCPGARPANEFSAGEIAALAISIEDTADAVRIYTAGSSRGIETLGKTIELLRGAKPDGKPADASMVRAILP